LDLDQSTATALSTSHQRSLLPTAATLELELFDVLVVLNVVYFC
jgi:hypothetical protein